MLKLIDRGMTQANSHRFFTHRTSMGWNLLSYVYSNLSSRRWQSVASICSRESTEIYWLTRNIIWGGGGERDLGPKLSVLWHSAGLWAITLEFHIFHPSYWLRSYPIWLCISILDTPPPPPNNLDLPLPAPVFRLSGHRRAIILC